MAKNVMNWTPLGKVESEMVCTYICDLDTIEQLNKEMSTSFDMFECLECNDIVSELKRLRMSKMVFEKRCNLLCVYQMVSDYFRFERSTTRLEPFISALLGMWRRYPNLTKNDTYDFVDIMQGIIQQSNNPVLGTLWHLFIFKVLAALWSNVD
jgi:hypothetical protein